MPSFVFTSPDGKSYTVNGPEGATAEQAFGILQQQLGAQAQPAAPEEGIMAGAGRVASDIAKQFAAPVAAAPFQIPRGAELGIKGLARQSMEGTPEAIMPASVYQPGLDTEEALFGPETQQQTAQRKLGAQRAVAAMPSIPGAETLSKIGDDVQKNIQNSLSKEGKKALRESQITGNIFKGEIDFGKNPTVEGYALQVANVFGSMAAPMATTLLTKSPGLGGAVGGAMAADEAGKNASEFISKMSNDDLAKNSPLYAELIAGGASPEEAKQLTIKKAAETGAALQGLVATFGDAFTGKLITGQFDNIITKMAGKTKVGRAAGAGVVGGGEESLQETMEGLASDVGIKDTVKNKELGEDSASNLVMGFLGGAGPAGIRGLVAKEEEAAAPPPPPPVSQVTPEAGLAGLVPPTPPALTPAPAAAAPQLPAAPQTLEEQIADMMQAAETPPVSQVTPEEEAPAQDMQAMLEELRTAKGEEPVAVEQVTPTGETSGTQAPQAVEAEAQGQEEPAAAEVTTKSDIDKIREAYTNYKGKEFQGSPELAEAKINRITDLVNQTGMPVNVWSSKGQIVTLGTDVNKPKNARLIGTIQPTQVKEEEAKFGEMGLEDFQAKHPKPYSVPPGILQTDITKMSDKDVLDRYSRDDLVTLAKLLDTNTSGTKAAVLANIRKVQANRERMKDMTADQLNAMSAEELRDLVTSLGGNPAYKGKDALVKFASEWRDNSLKRTREMVSESNHVRYVVQSVKRGNQNISDENINRYAAELWDAVDPDTQKDLYAKLLRKRALSLFAPPYMGVPPTIVSLRDEADRTKDDKEARKLTDLADALQKLYDKTRESEKPAAKVESAPSAAPEDAAKAKAKQDLEDALGDLSMILTKGTRLNIMPEDEQKLLPVLTRVMDAAFRLGYIKFKEAAKYVLDTIRSRLGEDAADQITLDHLQGAYIGMAGKYQDQGASSKKEVVSIESLEELEEEPGAAEEKVWSLSNPEDKFEAAQAVADHFTQGNEFASITAARTFLNEKFGIDVRPGTPTAKQADEAIEAGVVLAAQKVVADGRKQGLTSSEIYDQLVNLYNRQPNLAVRTSTSVSNQAYSTPVPLAFVASELAGITNKTTSVYEPTAGNGVLVIGADPKNLVLNEIDSDRVEMLKRLYPDAKITQGNALETNTRGKDYQAVIENPPFGKVGDISNIDHDIALHSLRMLDDNGRAVLILGGVQASTEDGRREGYRGKAKREFYYELYDKYNVVDHFTVGGNLYAKQGTTYPVDVIVIDGIGKSQRDLPAADLPQLITSYEQLKEKLNETRVVSGEPGRAGRTDIGAGAEGQAAGEGLGRGAERPGGEPGTEGGRPIGGGEPGVQGAEPAAGGQREPAGGRTGQEKLESENVPGRGADRGAVAGTGETVAERRQRGAERSGPGPLGGVSVVSGERVQSGLTDRAGLEQETENQVGYSPFSQANSVGTLVPKAMAEAINNSLAALEAAVGDIDSYVADDLQMDLETVRTLFSAEQVDALALSIKNAEEGKGFIIGDQTGVGKGRVVAAMIRYALVNDKIPIFVTEKPNLYSDMIRDLDDIGMTDELALDTAKPKIFITNSDEKIPYTLLREKDGEIVENNLILRPTKTGAGLDGVMKSMINSDSLGDYKVIFTSYSQLQTVKGKETERQRFINHFGPGNYLIFDESHNAGGAGEQQARTKEQRAKAEKGESLVTGRAAFVRNLVRNAFGTFFSSATYAKRPEVMDLYSSTDMKLAVGRISELAEAIKAGGIPMQQTVAQMLTQAGQYIRRERTFAGVSYDTKSTEVDKKTAENMASAMRMVLGFSRAKEAVVKGIQKEFDKQGAKIGGVGEKTTVQGANFGSTMHNLIDQMLLSLKAQDSVRFAIERLKAGEKVVLTVANTMGSFLKEYAEDMGLAVGDEIDLSFADLYQKYLEKQRMITIKRPGGQTEQYRLTDEDLGEALVKQYAEIENFIQNAGFGSAPISPIDYMHAELRKAKVVGLDGKERNVQTDEITGRTVTVSYESGRPTLKNRAATIAKRVNAVRGFNNGDVDVIILNQAGSTGLSLHASSKFKDQRKRHMILVQPEKNIDTHMQMLGRVHRTGQIIPPSYSQMMADIPAEMRPAAVLLKKMASLNANTTASRKSAVTAEGAVDFMNDYGGQIVQEYLRDNREVYELVGGNRLFELAADPQEGTEDEIRKFTGYLPILPIKMQEEIYKDLIERYNDLVQREDSMGTNKLEAKAFDLGAKTVSSTQITEGKEDPSVFAQPAFMEKVDVKRTVKPFSKEEVQKQVDDSLMGMTAAEASDLMIRKMKERATEYDRAVVKEMESVEKPDPVKIEKFKASLNSQYDHAKTIAREYPIGTPVSIKNTNGVFLYGVVTNVEGKGKTKNPVAGSDWKMTLALANGDAKSITINFSQIGTTYTLAKEETIQWLNPETLQAERIPLVDLFDKGAQVRREKRWMVTGNILAGYAAVGNTGQIINYTKEDGTTAQGILMSRTFDFEKQQKNAPVKLSSVEKVMAFFNKFGEKSEVSTQNGVLKIQYRGGNQYRFTAPSSKRDGGSYYLDSDLTNIVGGFTKSGPVMSTTIYSRDELQDALRYIMSERDESFVAVSNKEEAREAFQVPLQNIEPDAEMISQNPNEVLLVDRDAMIRKYQSLRQQRAGLVKKFMRGEAGLSEQQRLTLLEELGSDIKNKIEATKQERRSAKNFFADATKAWDQGVISDDVYAVIKTLYEKFPFVLESLKFSVTKRPEKSDAAGQFFALARLVRLYKGTNGVTDPVTIRHEIVHSLEQMMDSDAAAALVQEWMDKLGRAMKTDKSPKAQTFFQAVMEFIDDPSLETYEAAVDALPSYDYYQYVNPSEYWAVNAEPLMKRKLGSGWDRFVLAVKRMFEGLKSLVGFDNQYAVHKAFNAIMNAQGDRITRSVLADYVASVAIPLENQNVRRNYKGGPAPLAEWTSPNESRLDDFIYRLQDKHVDTKRVVQAITDEIGDIEDQWDPYLREELYHGRVAKQTTDFLEREMQPMLKEMVKRGVSLADLEEYLHNRHAKEYNELVASRNPGMPDEGSGIKTQDALDYLNGLAKTPEKKKNLEHFAAEIDKFVKGTQDLLVSSGMEKQETIDEWNKKFQFYVPLNRDADELDFVVTGTGLGKGFGTKGRFVKTATGSLKTVVDIFGNIALQRERAIIRAEKARVGRALYGLAITSPNPEFWMAINPAAIKNKKKLIAELKSLGLRPDDAENIIQEPRVPTFDKQTGQVKYEVNPALRNSPNVFPVRINGEDRFIFFNPGDPRAKRMVEALKNLDAQQMNEALNMVAELTRKYAAMNTQYNPVFGLWNFARDTMAGAINLNGTPLENRKAEVFKNSFVAVRAIYRDLRTKGATTPEMQKWIDLFEKFQKVGGQTGYREQFSRSEERASIVRRELEKLDQGNARKAANAVFDWLSDYNDSMENAVRLAAFKAALEEGMSEERAASLAKNLTVNFNRKGQMTSNINALFAFFNASVQGTSRMLQLLVDRTPDGKYKLSSTGKKIIAGGMLIGVVQAVALSMAGFDEDEPPEFLKNKNLIIPIPGKNYLIVPMPLGLNVFPNTGRILTEFAMSRRKDAGKLGRQLASVVLDAFNPLGSSGLAQTIAPTIIDPFVALAENKDAFGRPISKEARATNPTPGYVRNRESSTALSQGLSYALNYITGGGKYGIGAVSPTADQLDYLAGQYAGGVGREIAKAVRFVGREISGEEVPPYAVPIVGKMYGETATPSAITDKFYKNVIMLAEHEGVIKRMREEKVSPTEYRREYPETKLIDQANRLENEITKLNRTKKELLAKPETEATKARIKRLDEQKTRMMRQFNERVSAAQQ